MSYDIYLLDPVTRKVIEFETEQHMRGGTYVLGGTKSAHLNITYNYGRFYYDLFGKKGIRFLYGKTAAETIPYMKEGMDLLADDATDDYWEPTEGNAKRALAQLVALASMRPDGIWDGD